jgi:hypothetical protein
MTEFNLNYDIIINGSISVRKGGDRYPMNLIYFSAMLGLIQIGEYSVEDAKSKKFLSYAKVAVMFSLIGISLGRAGF